MGGSGSLPRILDEMKGNQKIRPLELKETTASESNPIKDKIQKAFVNNKDQLKQTVVWIKTRVWPHC